MCLSRAFLTLLLTGLGACGGSSFQAGEPLPLETTDAPTAATPDASSDASAGDDKFTGTELDAPIAADSSGQFEASSTDGGSSRDAGQDRSPDAAADSAPSDCPDVGCLCVVATPPDCPAGWPYVPHGGGMCCNWPAP